MLETYNAAFRLLERTSTTVTAAVSTITLPFHSTLIETCSANTTASTSSKHTHENLRRYVNLFYRQNVHP